MTTEQIAAAIPAPVEQGRRCRAYAAHTGDGFQAYFALDGGRARSYAGPIFDHPRKVGRLVRLLNQPIDPAPRPAAPVIPAALPSRADEETGEPDQARRTGAPAAWVAQLAEHPVRVRSDREGAGSIPALGSGAPRLCAGCGEPLPSGARPNRRTHNAACRQAASRAAAEGTAAASSGATPVVTLSGPSVGVALARHVNDVIAASNPAARPTHAGSGIARSGGGLLSSAPLRGAPAPAPLTLGLAER